MAPGRAHDRVSTPWCVVGNHSPSLMSVCTLGKQTSFSYTRREVSTPFLALSISPSKTPEISWDKLGKRNKSPKGSRCGDWNPKMEEEIPDSTPYRAKHAQLRRRTTKSEREDSTPPSGGPRTRSRQAAQRSPMLHLPAIGLLWKKHDGVQRWVLYGTLPSSIL